MTSWWLVVNCQKSKFCVVNRKQNGRGRSESECNFAAWFSGGFMDTGLLFAGSIFSVWVNKIATFDLFGLLRPNLACDQFWKSVVVSNRKLTSWQHLRGATPCPLREKNLIEKQILTPCRSAHESSTYWSSWSLSVYPDIFYKEFINKSADDRRFSSRSWRTGNRNGRCLRGMLFGHVIWWHTRLWRYRK